MARFIRTSKVRFEDCDLAGIVFYPNYILMLTRLIEDWFSEALDVPWGKMHRELKLGFPTVSMQVAFKKASRLDELLEWSLEVRKLRTKSLTLGVSACCQGEERVAIEITIVHCLWLYVIDFKAIRSDSLLGISSICIWSCLTCDQDIIP